MAFLIARQCDQHSIGHKVGYGWYRVDFPVSQQTLADMTGLTRETVNTVVKDVEELNVIRMPRKLRLELHEKNILKALPE